ncbi:MAG: RluA family pseudouridine synthase [Terriglobales bacterium]
MPLTTFVTTPADAGRRLDQFLTGALGDVSRSRVQRLIAQEKVTVNGATAKASLRLEGNETIAVTGEVQLPPLKAEAEDIPLDVVYEDKEIAVINKPAGMMVHAGAGATSDARSRGTLVNALLHHMKKLSKVGGELRPGIVHRLDKETSGLILVAKNDAAHRNLGNQFSGREIKKKYIALVQGWPKSDSGTINAPVSRDRIKRTRMTTRGKGGRDAITHYKVTEKIESAYGKFALLEVKIDTGRTHQIRVHMASLGHPVVGDTLYGASRELSARGANASGRASKYTSGKPPAITLSRNFLHAGELQFLHPRTEKKLTFGAPLPKELALLLRRIQD